MEKTKKEIAYLKTIRRLVGEKARIQNSLERSILLRYERDKERENFKNRWHNAENRITDMKSETEKEKQKTNAMLYAKDMQIEELKKALGESFHRYQVEVEKNIELKAAYRLVTLANV